MFKIAGFISGTILSLILGFQASSTHIFYLVCSALSFVIIILVICLRLLASVSIGFWQVWIKRWKPRVDQALLCLEKPNKIPKLQVVSVTLDAYGNRRVHKTVKHRTLAWALIDYSLYLFLVSASGLILIVVLFCFIEGIVKQVDYRRRQKLQINLKVQLVWKLLAEQAQKTLDQPLNESVGTPNQSRKKKKLAQEKQMQRKRDLYVVGETLMLDKTYPSQIRTVYINQLNFASHWQQSEQKQPIYKAQTEQAPNQQRVSDAPSNILSTILSLPQSASSINNETQRKTNSKIDNKIERALSIQSDLIERTDERHIKGSVLVLPYTGIDNSQL